MPYRLGLWLLLALVLGCGGVPTPVDPPADAATPWFTEQAAAAGLDFTHVRAPQVRYLFPEIMSGGGAWLDYDGDGLMDLYLVQGGVLDPADRPAQGTGPTNRLYRNRGDGTFEDATQQAGVGDDSYGMGAAVGDVDGDGHADLYVTNVGPNRLYRNRGDGTFEDATQRAGVGHPGWGSSAAFFDADHDGDLDLFLVNYVGWQHTTEVQCFAGGNARDYCQPENYNAPAPDIFYENLGAGRFRDATADRRLDQAFGNGLGVAVGDFDDDGRLDLYVTNDGNPNQLWLQQPDGTFADRGLVSGSALNRQGMTEAGMGVAAVDPDYDGDLDLFMTHLRDETHTFYQNLGGGVFSDATIATGLSVPSIAATGFGLGFADFDHDGHLDLFVANGRVGRALASPGMDPYGEPNQLFRGLGGVRFEEVQPRGGVADDPAEAGRAAALADYDNDGDLDVLVVNNGGHVRLLRNDRAVTPEGQRGAWIRFQLRDADGHEAIGARLRATVGTQPYTRLVQPAGSYQAAHDARLHLGLGTALAVDTVTVIWPDGTREAFGRFAAGQTHVLRRGGGTPDG